MEGHLIDYPASIGIEKAGWQTGKGINPLFEYNCLCLQVNPIVGHSSFLWYGMKRSQSLID